jgi:hypothetical protein
MYENRDLKIMVPPMQREHMDWKYLTVYVSINLKGHTIRSRKIVHLVTTKDSKQSIQLIKLENNQELGSTFITMIQVIKIHKVKRLQADQSLDFQYGGDRLCTGISRPSRVAASLPRARGSAHCIAPTTWVGGESTVNCAYTLQKKNSITNILQWTAIFSLIMLCKQALYDIIILF